MSTDTPECGPHHVDQHVGFRIRMRRKEVGITQSGLATAVGVTFQQVQKYERGSNRVSASKLFEIARALHVPLTYFYEGLEDQHEAADASHLTAEQHAFLMNPEGLEIARVFPRLSRSVQRRTLELVRALAAENAEPLRQVTE